MKAFPFITLLFSISISIQINAQKVQVNVIGDSTQVPPPIIYKINTGYNEQFEKDITSAVSVVKAGDLKIIPDDIITNRLQGLVPGMNIIGNGSPGALPEVMFRGLDTYWAVSPLYIVDGVPLDEISLLNADDVESIVVLKDAGSASIYGAKAMNGVIIINTKRGKEGLKVRYETTFGWNIPGKGPGDGLLNTGEYAKLQWKVYENDNYDEVHPIYGLSTQTEPTIPEWAGNTDWYAEMTRKATVQRHQISVSGGKENAFFFGSFGSHNEEGLLIHTYSKKYHLRFNSEWKFLDDRIKAGENFTVAFQKSNHAPTGETNPFFMGPYRSQSIIPVYMDRTVPSYGHVFQPGDYGGTGISQRLGNSTNVVADLTRNKDDYNFNMGFFGNAWVDVQILKGLHFRSSFGGTYITGYALDYSEASYENSENAALDYLNEESQFSRDGIWSNVLQYNNDPGIHNIKILAGYERGKSHNGRYMSAGSVGYFSDKLSYRTLSNGSNYSQAYSYYWKGSPSKSLFLQANYILLDKYFFSINIRNDKADFTNTVSVSRTDLQELYSSFSTGWNIGKEEFFDDISWINDLTLRASYGKTGNINTNWEYSKILDLGFDWKIGKINMTFDWYKKESDDVLVATQSAPGTGMPEFYFVNSASLSNTGIDVQIKFSKKWNIIGLNANLVVSSYSNQITSITKDIDYFTSNETRIGNVCRYQPGHEAGEFFGYRVTGLFRNAQEVTEAPQQDGAEPGFFRYENIDNSDNAITPDDRTFIGSPHPDFTMGLNLGFSLQNFDMSALLYWSQGNQIFNFTRWWTDFWPSFQGQKSERLLYESWTETNQDARVPKASNKSNFSTNTQINSYYVEDGSYLRMKSVQLGYSFGKETVTKVHLSSLRIYIQALNLFTLTRYTGLDPEIPGISGIDMGGYPNTKQILFGIKLEI